jgi:tetratricopeptide (TPR) repeat protein
MNTDTIKRFLTALSSAVEIERGELYQLVQSAETSYYLRDIHSQREIGLLLQSFVYPFNQVGKYYESIYLYRTGQYDKARELLESVVESAPSRYRSKALLSLSTVEQSVGHFEESLRLRLQAAPSSDPLTLIEAQQGIAILRSVEGDHRAAVRDLERLMPLAHIIGKYGHPAYFNFLNNYAVGLSKSGRIEEAEQVVTVVAASPLVNRYPEWQETLAEIISKRKSRSIVSLSGLQQQIEATEPVSNVIQFPTGTSVSVSDIRAMLEESRLKGVHLTPLQLLGAILAAVLEDRITDAEIERICTVYYDTVRDWWG